MRARLRICAGMKGKAFTERRMGELLTADELAERLKVSPDTVKVWARVGRIPAVRLSPKVLRFDLSAVLGALTADERKAVRHVC